MVGSAKVLLRLNLGTTTKRTTPEKTPCRDPAFTDQFTFNVRVRRLVLVGWLNE
jgi:hypothetical protein